MTYTFRYRREGDKRDWANLPISKEVECNKRDARDIATNIMIITPSIEQVIILKKNSGAKKLITVNNPN